MTSTCLITGGSGGIARAVAATLRAQGWRVARVGRALERLDPTDGDVLIEADVATEAGAASQRQLQTAMNYLQLQSQQMQAMQQQYMAGQAGKWSFGGAYRPPDSNINLSGSYQQGRANIVMSMVPDEGAPLLGPNGFTQGVGPANLGLSLNVHI